MHRISIRIVLTTLALGTAACRPSGPPSLSAPPAPRSKSAPTTAPNDAAAEEVAASDVDLSGDAREQVAEQQQPQRQGIGTGFGEQRFSSIVTVPFERGSQQPDATLAIHYNDTEGIRALARGTRSFRRSRAAQHSADGSFVLRLIDEHGQELFGADVAGRRYALGLAGARYQIGVENHNDGRYEVVASVDGLDVIDGGPAGLDKRGYVLEPHSSMMLEGWRTSDDTVAAFRFSTMEDSYAQRRGIGRNVGVIGAAFFHEEGGVPSEELHRRHHARPFSSDYAPAPPPP